MRASIFVWLFVRGLRWALWLGGTLYYVEFILRRDAHLNQFGHLVPTTEFWMFFFPLAAIFVGFLELAAREMAARPRPRFGRDWIRPAETDQSQSGSPAELNLHRHA